LANIAGWFRVCFSNMRAYFLVGLAVLGVACGGKVELSSGGGGGAGSGGGGGGGATTSSTSTSTNSTSSTTTSSTDTPPTGTPNPGQVSQLCAAICADASKEGCEASPNCADECAAGYAEAADCGSAYFAMLTCVKDEIEEICNGAPACQAELDAMEKCDSSTPGQPPPSPPACGPVSCTGWADNGGTSGCDCERSCGGDDFRVICETDSGSSACECYRGDELVATCKEPGSATCEITGGCCSEAFFHYGLK
jgi:hypothetical protein